MKRATKEKKRSRKKIIVFLVEGYSELNALGPTLSALYDSIDPEYEVFFPPMYENREETWGDFTSKNGIDPKTVEKCIDKLYLDNFLKKQKLYAKDISEIIHIFDMDGAYIEDENVVYGKNPMGIDKVYYAEDKILTTNVAGIQGRNKKKRENIDHLLSLETVKIISKSIPYSGYFFSSNLDHFLHNDANIPEGRDKVDRAEKYALKYVDDPDGFVRSIESLPGALLDMSYEDSWEFIRERGNHSLQRHTNINILFRRLMEQEPV